MNQVQEFLSKQPKEVKIDRSVDESLMKECIHYLLSKDAKQSLESDCYWPKWNSPWWHLSLLYEMGACDRIPLESAIQLMNKLKESFPEGVNSLPIIVDGVLRTSWDPPCACQMGNVYQILFGVGIDVDKELPWMRNLMMSLQMKDGGLSCDETAYEADPQASSIVGTISPLESILLCTKREFSKREEEFLDRGAECLLKRQLCLGCDAPHNLEEKEMEGKWLKLCFPRFYLYDVLRGLEFILKWSEMRDKKIQATSIQKVVEYLCKCFPDGLVKIERHSYEGVRSRDKNEKGEWTRTNASLFPALEKVSEIGRISPYLTERWNESKKRMDDLIQKGLIV